MLSFCVSCRSVDVTGLSGDQSLNVSRMESVCTDVNPEFGQYHGQLLSDSDSDLLSQQKGQYITLLCNNMLQINNYRLAPQHVGLCWWCYIQEYLLNKYCCKNDLVYPGIGLKGSLTPAVEGSKAQVLLISMLTFKGQL